MQYFQHKATFKSDSYNEHCRLKTQTSHNPFGIHSNKNCHQNSDMSRLVINVTLSEFRQLFRF